MFVAALLTLALRAPVQGQKPLFQKVIIPEWARELYLTNDLLSVDHRGVLLPAYRALPSHLSLATVLAGVEEYQDLSGRLGEPVPERFVRYGLREYDAPTKNTKYVITSAARLQVTTYTGDARNAVINADYFYADTPARVQADFRRNARALRRELGNPMFLSNDGRSKGFTISYWWSDDLSLTMMVDEVDAKSWSMLVSFATSPSDER